MALRLKGSSSGYAEIDASADAGSVTLTLPATAGTINVKDGSGTTNVGTGVNLGNPGANIFTISNTGGERLRIAADGSVSIPGNLNISGVLTYEDVTSVDAIGLSTFRDGLITKDVGIATISSSVSDTAVDVFIYDTSKDSDGGAWRKRTSHTSWYNEEAAAGVRGSRKEFPAVAVIVLDDLTSTGKMTIYDGDDPDLPMWMVFTGGAAAQEMLPSFNATKCSCLSALNGQICVGNSTYDLEIIDFIKDGGTRISTGQFANKHNISTRNNALGSTGTSTGAGLVDRAVNDVAMTVLPNAPVDDATGLPIPTIAVATDGGISVIKDDGNVVDMYPTGSSVTPANEIYFTESNNIAFMHNAYWVYYYKLPSADTSATYWNQLSGFIGRFTDNTRVWDTNYEGIPINVGSSGITNFLEDRAIGHTNGLDIIDINEGGLLGNGMHAGISTDFNTGYMLGDIKGAFLSDTDTTNLTGVQAVTNGTFNSDVSGWTTNTSTITYNSNNANIARNSGPASSGIYQEITLVPGKTYSVSVDVSAVNGGTYVSLYLISDNGAGTSQEYRTAAAGTPNNIIGSYTALTASTRIAINATGNSSGTATIDNISVRLAEHDRSFNGPYQSRDAGTGAALGIYGTVTKTAVATGAELVAYSGFSASNVLFQPYNSDLNPGTGDYSFMCWFKTASTGTEEIFMRRFSGTSPVTGGMQLRIISSSSLLEWYVREATGSNTAYTARSIAAVDDGNWHCAVGTREGATAKLYMDGVLQNSTSISTGVSHDPGTAAKLVIGAEEITNSLNTFQNPADFTSLALVRYSLTAPSAAQVKKMYEDEKVLFQENAKCTLHGSSDAVTALAYDEVTDQLHVGTSSGRSDFQGLRRINNTTTAVSTAISAHDTFIIEQ